MNDNGDIQDLVTKSGNSFHSRVVSCLEAEGWSIMISPYYNDNISGKPREIDLLAEKTFPWRGAFGDRRGELAIKLFIECKYVPQATVFWFHAKDSQRARALVLRSTPMKETNTHTDKHHYLNTEPYVAKLFASSSKKADENEIIYKALNQSINAMVYLRDSGSIVRAPQHGKRDLRLTITYPVIVCNSFSRFHRVDMGGEAEAVPIEDNFQIEVNYAYVDGNQRSTQEYFLIDVIDFNKMKEFLVCLQGDVDAMPSPD